MLPKYFSGFDYSDDKNTHIVITNAVLAKLVLENNLTDNELMRNEEREYDYARLMLSGNWIDNGDSICISVEGFLLDGQTRLGAVIKADEMQPGFSIPLRYTVELWKDSFPTIDTGRTRTPARILVLTEGVDPYALQQLGAAIRIVYLYFEQRLGELKRLSAFPKHLLPKLVLNDYKGIIDSRDKQMRFHGNNWPGRHNFPASHAIACHYLLSQKSEKDADEFFDRLFDGVELSRGHPVLTLRARFENTANLPGGAERRINEAVVAWNAYRSGKTLDSVRLSDGKRPEII